jgi:hypothetical protein
VPGTIRMLLQEGRGGGAGHADDRLLFGAAAGPEEGSEEGPGRGELYGKPGEAGDQRCCANLSTARRNAVGSIAG